LKAWGERGEQGGLTAGKNGGGGGSRTADHAEVPSSADLSVAAVAAASAALGCEQKWSGKAAERAAEGHGSVLKRPGTGEDAPTMRVGAAAVATWTGPGRERRGTALTCGPRRSAAEGGREQRRLGVRFCPSWAKGAAAVAGAAPCWAARGWASGEGNRRRRAGRGRSWASRPGQAGGEGNGQQAELRKGGEGKVFPFLFSNKFSNFISK